MSKLEDLVTTFIDYQLQMKEFILKVSNLQYLEGSTDVIEGGARFWLPLLPQDEITQDVLCESYTIFVDTIMEKCPEDDKIAVEFRKSADRVLSFLKQQDIVMESTLDEVFDEIHDELQKQILLSSDCVE
ncbi:hypothetical protein [Paenibacillus kandeliae]|uniref:hypothetical protein n=1 Tax=Paenibacillus kandeliae TaxID=3231269 RepID=UPI003459792E